MILKNDKGVTATEYGLLGALISVCIIGAVTLTGVYDKDVFCYVATKISSVLDDSSGGDCSQAKTQDCQQNASTSTDQSVLDAAAIAQVNPDFLASTTSQLADPSSVDNWRNSDANILGGTTTAARVGWMLERMNNIDPITGIYGLYDKNGNAISSFNESAIDSAFSWQYGDPDDSGDSHYYYNVQTAGGGDGSTNDYFEITTKSGQTYMVSARTDNGDKTDPFLVNKKRVFVILG